MEGRSRCVVAGKHRFTAEHPVPGRRSLSSSSSVSRKSASRRAASHTCPPVVPIVEPVPLFARSTCDCARSGQIMSVSDQESPQARPACRSESRDSMPALDPNRTSISTSRSHGISEAQICQGGDVLFFTLFPSPKKSGKSRQQSRGAGYMGDALRETYDTVYERIRDPKWMTGARAT